MRRLARVSAVVVVIAATTLTVAASSAVAAGPEGPGCGTFTLRTNERIEGRLFAKGTYRLHAKGIACAKVNGKNGLFAQFLRLSDAARLPRPWKSLTGAVGAPKFVASPGVGFRAQRISD